MTGHVNWILEDLTSVNVVGQNFNIDIRIFVTGGKKKEMKPKDDIHNFSETEAQKRYQTLSHSKGTLGSVSTESDAFDKDYEEAHIDVPLRDNGLISFMFSRPNIEKILEDEILSRKDSSNVSVCGMYQSYIEPHRLTETPFSKPPVLSRSLTAFERLWEKAESLGQVPFYEGVQVYFYMSSSLECETALADVNCNYVRYL